MDIVFIEKRVRLCSGAHVANIFAHKRPMLHRFRGRFFALLWMNGRMGKLVDRTVSAAPQQHFSQLFLFCENAGTHAYGSHRFAFRIFTTKRISLSSQMAVAIRIIILCIYLSSFGLFGFEWIHRRMQADQKSRTSCELCGFSNEAVIGWIGNEEEWWLFFPRFCCCCCCFSYLVFFFIAYAVH